MKRIVISGAALALAVAGTGISQAEKPTGYKVTGGGQILVTTGAGSTIAFNARGDETDADGQIQYINREAGTGQAQVVEHGEVTCVFAFSPTEDGGSARIGGTLTSKEGVTRPFTLDVIDMGEGKDAGDIVEFRDNADDNCLDDDNNNSDDFAPTAGLGRGNVQVHKF